MGARATVRRGLEATIGKQRTDRIVGSARRPGKRAATATPEPPEDPLGREIAGHLAAIRAEMVRSRAAGTDSAAQLKALRGELGRTDGAAEAAEKTVQELRAIRRELNSARTIPSVPIALRLRSVDRSVEHILADSRFDNVMVGIQKHDCLAAALRATTIDGMVCEFGVYKGESLTQIATYFPDRTVHGFDSFAGLPESWSGTSEDAGAFDIGGTPPSVPVENVEFHGGLFDTTVPAFAGDHSGPFAFVHLDADLYR